MKRLSPRDKSRLAQLLRHHATAFGFTYAQLRMKNLTLRETELVEDAPLTLLAASMGHQQVFSMRQKFADIEELGLLELEKPCVFHSSFESEREVTNCKEKACGY